MMSRAVRSFKVCQSMREALGVSAHGYNKMVRSCVRIATSRQSIEGENCSSTLSTCLRISSRSWRRSRTPRTTPSSYTHTHTYAHIKQTRPPRRPSHSMVDHEHHSSWIRCHARLARSLAVANPNACSAIVRRRHRRAFLRPC